MEKGKLSLRIEREHNQLSGQVVLENFQKEEIRIWQEGSQWGDEILSFELIDNDKKIKFFPSPQIYTVNIPAFLTIEPGNSYVWQFDLKTGEWQSNVRYEGFSTENLKAKLEIQDTKLSKEFNIWTGILISNN